MTSINANTAIDRWFRRYRSDLVGYLKKTFCRDNDNAEDIAQDAFIRLQRLDSVGHIKNPKAHLFKTATNIAIDEQRRRAVRINYLMRQGGEEKINLDTPPAMAELEQKLLYLESTLQMLPAKCRQAFILHRIEGRNYQEIAKELSVSVSSVEKYLIRALKHCKDVLES